jgi:hypothetical protein
VGCVVKSSLDALLATALGVEAPVARGSSMKMLAVAMSIVKMPALGIPVVRMSTVKMLPLGRQTCVSKPRL